MKAAILLHHGIGDVVMALPLLRCIDASLPMGSEVHVLLKNTQGKDVIELFEWRAKFSFYFLGAPSLARWGASAATVLALRKKEMDLLLMPHACSPHAASVLSFLVNPARSIGPGSDGVARRSGKAQHKKDYYMRFAEVLGFRLSAPCSIKLDVPEKLASFVPKDIKVATGKAQRVVLVAPGSGPVETHKRWPAEQYRRLIAHLLRGRADLFVGLLGSPEERELLSACLPESGEDSERCRPIFTPTTKSLMAALMNASCLVSNCNGAAHLAAIADVPIVAIYGPTDPVVTSPLSDKLLVVRSGLGCSPCYSARYIKGCGNPVCMSSVRVDDVLQKVKEVLFSHPSYQRMGGR